jgi:hypothetical protein
MTQGQVSKGTADRLKISRAVGAALSTHEGVIEAGLDNFGIKLPKGVAISGLFGWLGTTLGGAESTLDAADLAHMAELADDDEPRARRDASVTAARGALLSASSAVSGVLGDSYAKKVGLLAPLAERPDMLLKQITHVADQLGEHAAPKSALEGATLDPKKLAASLGDVRDALKTALGDVAREDREKQTSMSARDAASARFTQVYSGVASILAGFCWLAGLDDLADSVRPTERKRAGMADEAISPTPPDVPTGDAAATKPS